MPDPFDSAAGATHSYGDGCNPPHVKPNPLDLAALREQIDQEMWRINRGDVTGVGRVLHAIVNAIEALSERSEWG